MMTATAISTATCASASGASDGSDFVEIPGEQIRPIRLALPIDARARPGFDSARLLIFALAIPFILAIAWNDLKMGRGFQSVVPTIMSMIFFAGIILVWLAIVIELTAQIVDFFSLKPILTIDQDGIFDRRSMNVPVTWKQVESVRLSTPYSFQSSVDDHWTLLTVQLKTRGNVAARRSSIRARIYLFRWKCRPDEVVVSAYQMSIPTRHIALAIMTIAKTNGATLETASGKPDSVSLVQL